MPAIRFIPADKCVHATVGAMTALPILAACRWWHVPAGRAMLLAAAAAFALGVLIEARQRVLNRRAVAAGAAPGHEVSDADILATGMGGVVVAVAFGLGVLP